MASSASVRVKFWKAHPMNIDQPTRYLGALSRVPPWDGDHMLHDLLKALPRFMPFDHVRRCRFHGFSLYEFPSNWRTIMSANSGIFPFLSIQLLMGLLSILMPSRSIGTVTC